MMKYFAICLFALSRVSAQTDSFFVESNYFYVIKANVVNVTRCSQKDFQSVAEIKVDSILYFNDTVVMKTSEFFLENARYIHYNNQLCEIFRDDTYYFSVFLSYKYSVFGLKDCSKNGVNVYVNKSSGFKMDYPIGPEYYYKRKIIKGYFLKLWYGSSQYYSLDINKTHKKKRLKKPKYLSCLELE